MDKATENTMENTMIFIHGAMDFEMEAILSELKKRSQHMVLSATYDGKPVNASNANQANGPTWDTILDEAKRTGFDNDDIDIVFIECRVYGLDADYVCDHHNFGDYGFGKPPKDYWKASSIGQVWGLIGKQPTETDLLVAAADHCLGAAYRGECPDVDPDKLARMRAEVRAKFQNRNTNDVMNDINTSTQELKNADRIELSSEIFVADMRGDTPWPELPEAACRADLPYISGPLIGPDGKKKYTCSGTENVINAFMNKWAPDNGLINIYGDSKRGFAGGYEK